MPQKETRLQLSPRETKQTNGYRSGNNVNHRNECMRKLLRGLRFSISRDVPVIHIKALNRLGLYKFNTWMDTWCRSAETAHRIWSALQLYGTSMENVVWFKRTTYM